MKNCKITEAWKRAQRAAAEYNQILLTEVADRGLPTDCVDEYVFLEVWGPQPPIDSDGLDWLKGGAEDE